MNVIQLSLLHFRPFKPRNDIPLHRGEGGREGGGREGGIEGGRVGGREGVREG